MSADRKLIEAQVTFGMFPVEGGAVRVTDAQEGIIADAVAGRAHRINHAAAVKRTRRHALPEALQILGQHLRSSGEGGLWSRACDALLDSEANGSDIAPGAECEVLEISEPERLRLSYDARDLPGIVVTFAVDGRRKTMAARTIYNHVMRG